MMNLAVTMSLWERTVYAGKMLVIGLGAVFTVLAVLWLSLVLFHLLVARADQGADKKTAAAVPAPAPAPVAPAVAPDNGALIAAITAAISAVLAEENGGVAPTFRVVAFRRAGE